MCNSPHSARCASIAFLLGFALPAQARLQPVAIGTGPLLILQQTDRNGADEWLVADLDGEGPAATFMRGAAAFRPAHRIDHAHLLAEIDERLSVVDLRRGSQRELSGRSVLSLHGGAVRMSSGPDRTGRILEQAWSTAGEVRVLCERELHDLHIDGDIAFGVDAETSTLVQVSLTDASLRPLPAVSGSAPRFALSPDRRCLAVGTMEPSEPTPGPARRGWVTVIDLVELRILRQWHVPPGALQSAMHVRWSGADALRYACATGDGWNIPLECVTRNVHTEEVRERDQSRDCVAPLRDPGEPIVRKPTDGWPPDGVHGAFRVHAGKLLLETEVQATTQRELLMFVDDEHVLTWRRGSGPTELLDSKTGQRRHVGDAPPKLVFLLDGVH